MGWRGSTRLERMFDSEETAGIGRELAAFLSGLRGLAELDEDTIIAGIAAADRLVSWANAGQLALIGELTRRRGDPEFVEDEIAAELRLSRPAAAHRLALALDLHRLPAVAAGLAAGRLDLPKAKAITGALHVLDPATAADVADHAVDHAAAHTVGQHRAWLRGSVLAADPAAAQARAGPQPTVAVARSGCERAAWSSGVAGDPVIHPTHGCSPKA